MKWLHHMWMQSKGKTEVKRSKAADQVHSRAASRKEKKKEVNR